MGGSGENETLAYEYAPAPGKGVKAEVEYVFFALNSGRQPTPAERKMEDTSGDFKLIHCEWSITAEATPNYNCHAWCGGVTTGGFVQPGEIKYVGAATYPPSGAAAKEWLPCVTRDGLLTFYATSPNKLEEKDKLTESTAGAILYEGTYTQTRFFTATTAPDPRSTRDLTAYTSPTPFDTGVKYITHSARATGSKTADGQVVIYESKLGAYLRIEHIAEQLRGTLYGEPKYLLAKKN